MTRHNTAVLGTGRIRARDIYDLVKVLEPMLKDIEDRDKYVSSHMVHKNGQNKDVRTIIISDCLYYNSMTLL